MSDVPNSEGRKLGSVDSVMEDGSPVVMGYVFWCPGCERPHIFRVARAKASLPTDPVWSFDGNMERPTFSPSLLVYGGESWPRCHLFLRNGRLEYQGDSEHGLANQTVDLPDLPEGW